MTIRREITDEVSRLIEHEPDQFIQRAEDLGLTHAEAKMVLTKHWETRLAASGHDERRLRMRERVVKRTQTRYIYVEADPKCISLDEAGLF